MGAATVPVFETGVSQRSATREKSQAVAKTMMISEEDGYQVHLVEITPGTSANFKPQSAADILCLDIHAFELEGAIGWVEQAQKHRIEKDELPLCIVVIGDENQLSLEDMWRVSEELEPAGAIFHTWPDNCKSFDEAFSRFGKSIASFYGRSTVPEAAAKQR
jgi:hypothetical protein